MAGPSFICACGMVGCVYVLGGRGATWFPGSPHQAGKQTGRSGMVVTVGSLYLSPGVVMCHFCDGFR